MSFKIKKLEWEEDDYSYYSSINCYFAVICKEKTGCGKYGWSIEFSDTHGDSGECDTIEKCKQECQEAFEDEVNRIFEEVLEIPFEYNTCNMENRLLRLEYLAGCSVKIPNEWITVEKIEILRKSGRSLHDARRELVRNFGEVKNDNI